MFTYLWLVDYLLNSLTLLMCIDTVLLVTGIYFAIQERPDPNSHFDASATLPSNTLTAKLLAVACIHLLRWL